MSEAPRATESRPIEPRDWRALQSVFSFAWAFQALEEKSDRLDPHHLASLDGASDLLVIAAALVLLLRAGSLKALCIFSAISLLNVAVELPQVMNHIVIAACVNMLILLRLGGDWLRGGLSAEREAESRSRLMRELTPTVQILVVMLYLFAFFHKLNWDFVDLEESCVAFSYLQTRMILPFLPPIGAALTALGIALTYAVELGIPILLLVPRTRLLGLAFGVVFHLGLGAHVPSFSILLFSLYPFFLPPALWEALARALEGLPVIGHRWRSIGLGLALGLQASWYGLFYLPPMPFVHWMRWTWLVATALLLLGLAWGCWRELRPDMSSVPPRISTPLSLFLFALVALNGMGPYLGLKTQGTFSMYSNLRTEGVSNHMLIPKGALQLSDLLDDLVEIEEPRPAAFRGYAQDRLLTRFELRRLLQAEREQGRSVDMQLTRSGEHFASSDMGNHPVFGEPIAWPIAKLLVFRPVPKSGVGRCSW